MLKFVRNSILIVFTIIFISGGITSYILIKRAYKTLPNVEKLVEEYQPIVPTIIYDYSGKIIDKLYVENRDVAGIDEIPKKVQNAFLAIEDKRFYRHHGFDYLRLTKALLYLPKYLITRKNVVGGGSTITQQLAKNAFIDFNFQETLKEKIQRKLQEVIIAVEIERKYTKDEILAKYINEIPYGNGTHGIKSAAKLYFNKELDDLNQAEAAFLAGLPQKPSWFNPYRHLERALNKQKLVLKQMYRFGFINKEEYKNAINTKITIADKNRRNFRAPAFTDVVTSKLFEMFDEDIVRKSGLKIYTSLDLRMQEKAEEALNNSDYIQKYPDLQGSIITIDSKNGDVKAIIGGRNFVTGNFNRAIMAQRQPGSAFKPFVYYTALQLGYPMNTIIEDSESIFGEWEPRNYSDSFRGNITMLQAMEKSVNIAAVKLLKKIIIKNVIKNARKAGIEAEIPYNLTVALGTIAVSPFELAKSYIPFSNGGYKIEPIFIKRIEDIYGEVIYEAKPKKEKIFDTKTVARLVHMMKNVVLNGSGRNSNLGIEQAGKTGTTNEFTNAWFSGFTSDFVTTLYVGYDDNKSMEKGMSGGSVAAPIWGDYVGSLIKDGIYVSGKFQFVDSYLKDKELILKEINNKTGLLEKKSNYFSRTAMFQRRKMPIEYSDKYSNGISTLLPKEEKNEENKKGEKK